MQQAVAEQLLPVPAAAAADGSRQYLTFTLGGEMFAVAILNVKEILEFGNITEIPLVPSFIRGVINLRGSVVPVIDLSVRFGRGGSELGKRSCIVIVEVRDAGCCHDIGIIVDAVSAVVEIPPSEMTPPPSFGATVHADYILGMGRVAGRFVIMLQIERVLAVEAIATLAQGAGRIQA